VVSSDLALRQIGAESPLNARRVRKYGVNVEEEEQPDPLPDLRTDGPGLNRKDLLAATAAMAD
jgi:hypothetical protein